MLILICLTVMGVSLYKLITITMDYKQGEKEYDILQSYTTELAKDPVSDPDEEQEADTLENADELCPISVDFEHLKQINPDLVCWLYIPVLDISYPVVQGTDNDYYLHRTFEGTENFAGSLFVDAMVEQPFQDPHTIIYGHSMKNQTMFGKLKLLLSDDLYRKEPVFWILTEEGATEYQMIDIRFTEAGSSTYTLFDEADDSFVTYIEETKAQAGIENPNLPEITADCRLVTLSTCAAAEGTARLVVQGIATEHRS